MSEKGVLSKSIASNISEAIIDKLGGTGYTPTEWSKNINLLGIASADIEEALASITEDTSSSDKGLLSLSIASDMGAMLNKKYNTSRGFKPCEVSSAVSMLSPLPEKTSSSAPICVFNDGADDVPLKKCEITLPASLDGYSSVDVVTTGKNLFNVADYSQIYTDRDGIDSYNYRYMIIQLKPNTTYTVSQNSGEYSGTPIILINNALPVGGANYFDLRKASDTKTYTTDSTGQLYIGSVNSYDDVAYARLQVCNVQIEVGSMATTYEPYTAPTTYTASLGRTIYGGTADIVNGKAEPLNLVDGTNLTRGLPSTTIGASIDTITASTRYAYYGVDNGGGSFTVSSVSTDTDYFYNILIFGYANGLLALYTNTNAGTDKTVDFSACDYIRIAIGTRSASYQVPTDLTNYGTIQLERGSSSTAYSPYFEPFTFTGQEVPTRLGYNAFWSDEGDTEVTYRADIDLYEAPSTLLGSNNTETEGNEEQEENE